MFTLWKFVQRQHDLSNLLVRSIAAQLFPVSDLISVFSCPSNIDFVFLERGCSKFVIFLVPLSLVQIRQTILDHKDLLLKLFLEINEPKIHTDYH